MYIAINEDSEIMGLSEDKDRLIQYVKEIEGWDTVMQRDGFYIGNNDDEILGTGFTIEEHRPC